MLYVDVPVRRRRGEKSNRGNYRFWIKPLDSWPRLPLREEWRSHNMTAPPYDTFSALSCELLRWPLWALEATVFCEFDEEELRTEIAKFPEHSPWQLLHDSIYIPALYIEFDCTYGRLQIPCDTYCDWWANLRAIYLTLVALRAVSRHQVTIHGEQYRGFLLPDPAASVGESPAYDCAAPG